MSWREGGGDRPAGHQKGGERIRLSYRETEKFAARGREENSMFDIREGHYFRTHGDPTAEYRAGEERGIMHEEEERVAIAV